MDRTKGGTCLSCEACTAMLETLLVVLSFVPTRADSVEHFYAWQDVAALQSLCAGTLSREEDLLCRYRLYPLTEDAAYLADLPSKLSSASAREYALLAGLWGYKASSGSLFNVIRCGRRAGRLLSQAKESDPGEPFVLLIEGQSFLFRPGVFGGDNGRALELLRELQRIIASDHVDGISSMEADLWVWYALKRMNDPAADAVQRSIEGRNPPPLYRAFLADPPS